MAKSVLPKRLWANDPKRTFLTRPLNKKPRTMPGL